MAKQFTLAKGERLKSRKQIEQLFKKGNAITVHPFKVYYTFYSGTSTPKLQTSNLQFGIGVNSRNFKKAVSRNRIKRLIREAYRLQKLPLLEKLRQTNTRLNVFFIYTDKDLPAYEKVYDKMSTVLHRLIENHDFMD